jgi:hypothetical protein
MYASYADFAAATSDDPPLLEEEPELALPELVLPPALLLLLLELELLPHPAMANATTSGKATTNLSCGLLFPGG